MKRYNFIIIALTSLFFSVQSMAQYSITIEIKDNKDFKPENVLKLQAGKEYLRRVKQKENVKFYIISPDDYFTFFKLLKEQNLDKFKSTYEERLIRFNKSQQILINSKTDKSDKDNETLEWLEELDKTIKELDDQKFKNELLKISLEEAQENVKVLAETLAEYKPEKLVVDKIKIPIPFNISILGEVSDEELIIKELQKYFTKKRLKTNDWDIKFFNNSKLQKSDVLRSLVKGQSRFNLIITGQIHHHAGKGDKKSNIISELKNPKYVPYIVGSDPRDLLTHEKILKAVENFLSE